MKSLKLTALVGLLAVTLSAGCREEPKPGESISQERSAALVRKAELTFGLKQADTLTQQYLTFIRFRNLYGDDFANNYTMPLAYLAMERGENTITRYYLDSAFAPIKKVILQKGGGPIYITTNFTDAEKITLISKTEHFFDQFYGSVTGKVIPE
jgi:hypothetical protein